MLPTFAVICEENTDLLKLKKNGQFPDEPVKTKVSQIHYVNSQTYKEYQVTLG
jgi:hypothetical protein